MHIYTAAEHCEQPEKIPDPCIQHPLSQHRVLVGAVLKKLQAELARARCVRARLFLVIGRTPARAAGGAACGQLVQPRRRLYGLAN